MAFEGVRSRLRSLAESGSEAAKQEGQRAPERVRAARERAREARAQAGSTVQKVAPGTDLERGKSPSAPSSRERIAKRLQSAGQMHKPIGDANLEPGADPRFMEEFGRGDADTGEWFGESEEPTDANAEWFGGSEDTVGTQGDFVMELLDERDHEGGHYAYDDEHERGMLDDGVDMDVGVTPRW